MPVPVGRGSSVRVWCVSSWERVICASVVCFQLGGVVCASVVCFQLGGGLLCSCDVFPAGSCASPAGRGRLCQQLGGVVCASSWEGVVCASVVCFQLGGGRQCSCGVLPALRGSSVPVWCDSSCKGVVWCVSSWEGVICASMV